MIKTAKVVVIITKLSRISKKQRKRPDDFSPAFLIAIGTGSYLDN